MSELIFRKRTIILPLTQKKKFILRYTQKRRTLDFGINIRNWPGIFYKV